MTKCYGMPQWWHMSWGTTWEWNMMTRGVLQTISCTAQISKISTYFILMICFVCSNYALQAVKLLWIWKSFSGWGVVWKIWSQRWSHWFSIWHNINSYEISSVFWPHHSLFVTFLKTYSDLIICFNNSVLLVFFHPAENALHVLTGFVQICNKLFNS